MYDEFQSSLIALMFILVFPSIILSVLAPFLISFFANLNEKVSNRLELELDKLIRYEGESQDEVDKSRTILKENLVIDQEINEQIKLRLIPSLSKRALRNYKDNFYSRGEKITPVKSLEYFESLLLFSSITFILFSINLLLVILMKFASVDLYFVLLDKISSNNVFLSLLGVFLVGLLFTFILFDYSKQRMVHYLPYAVPILFYEPEEEKYFRRETIRSLTSYNMDNLIDRRDQKKVRDHVTKSLDQLLNPLLRDEFLISARAEFARKIAWQEYSGQFEKSYLKEKDQPILTKLFMGEKLGNLKIPDKDLLGLNSDYEFINENLARWDDLSNDRKMYIYFQVYRLSEYIFKELVYSLNIQKENVEYNLFTSIKELEIKSLIPEDAKQNFHNLRYRRNKLMHEPGVSLEVSSSSIREILGSLELLLTDITQGNGMNSN